MKFWAQTDLKNALISYLFCWGLKEWKFSFSFEILDFASEIIKISQI